MKKLFLLIAIGFGLLISCSKDESNNKPVDQLISPYDSDALSEVLIMPAGTQEVNGQPPASSGGSAPTVTNPNSSTLSSNGSTAPLFFNYANVVQNLGGCYVQVDGAGRYFRIPYGSQSGVTGQLQLPIGIPTNVDEGTFCVNFSVYDANGRVSNIVKTCVTVLRLGTGALQVSLSWNNSSDQDLYVVTPNGDEIYYDDRYDGTGGSLDRDDVDGFGPENIYWQNNAPDGTYTVKVDDYSSISTGTNFYITVSAPGITRSFNGSTRNGNTVTVTTFYKNGNTISF